MGPDSSAVCAGRNLSSNCNAGRADWMHRKATCDGAVQVKFYIRERRDGSATLMSAAGGLLWTFPSVASAQDACRHWYRIEVGHIEYFRSPISDGTSYSSIRRLAPAG